uniref:Uncharacterized protein n=1 Tax=Rhizophora mucronata TaxID=61149 RepID=A0A2P2LJD8_RHIMU
MDTDHSCGFGIPNRGLASKSPIFWFLLKFLLLFIRARIKQFLPHYNLKGILVKYGRKLMHY